MATAAAPQRRPGRACAQRAASAPRRTCCSRPGLLWLLIFFIIPTIQMFTYSISTGSIETGFKMTFTLDAYAEALDSFGKQFLNSILYGGVATHPDPRSSASRSPTRSPSAAAATRTCCCSWSSRRSSRAS